MRKKNFSSESPLSLGIFLTKLESRLKSLKRDELTAIILRHAKKLAPPERDKFLAVFTEAGKPETKPMDDPALIKNIDSFIGDLESGVYCDGWGYDREIGNERAFGDESWVSEMDDLFDRAGEAFLSGNRELATEAYGLLLRSFSLDEESGTFCGPKPPDSMVQTDVDEAKARYYRSLYETLPPKERVGRLLQAVNDLEYVGSASIGLRAMLEADDKPLEDFAEFLLEWRQALKKKKPVDDYWREDPFQWLLREAVVLSEGTKGLAALAEEEGDRQPEVYFDWVQALLKEGKPDEAVVAARKGAVRILNPDQRARMADQLAELAIERGDEGLHLAARRRAWRADPSIKRLLLLCGANDPDDDEIDKRLKAEFVSYRKGAFKPNRRLAAILELLVGEYSSPVVDLGKTKALGWSDPTHPGYVVFPFLLLAGSGVSEPEVGSVMADYLSELDSLGHYELALNLSGDILRVPENYKKISGLLSIALRRYPVTPEQRQEFPKAAKRIALKRIRAIVSKKHRRAYERAARLLLGCIEALDLAGQSKEGAKLLAKVREEFPRHSAFWREFRVLAGGRKID